MAKNKKSKKGRAVRSTSAGVAVASSTEDDEHVLSASGDPRKDPPPPGSDDAGSRGGRASALTAGGGHLRLYKPGQGYYTRVVTAVAAGIILLFGAQYIRQQLQDASVLVKFGVPVVVFAVVGALLFWIVGLNRKCNDFFIATEGEMKKVSWSSRREVVGSTKVVLVFTLFMACMLFVVDLLFMVFFGWINVLQVKIIDTLFGAGT